MCICTVSLSLSLFMYMYTQKNFRRLSILQVIIASYYFSLPYIVFEQLATQKSFHSSCSAAEQAAVRMVSTSRAERTAAFSTRRRRLDRKRQKSTNFLQLGQKRSSTSSGHQPFAKEGGGGRNKKFASDTQS